MSKALIPGSFDPMTVGHVDLVERTASIFDDVVVAVMINDSKEYLFTMEERKKIASLSLLHLKNVSVISYSGWLYKLFDELSADALVKGIRNSADLEYENKMAAFNLQKNSKAHTLYLPADNRFENVSSTLFRSSVCSGDFEKYLSPLAKDYVISLLEEKK